MNDKKNSPTTKMLVGYFLLIFILQTPSDVEGIEILEQLLSPIIEFKENLISGIFGKGKCGCPCRTYWVPKCEIAYVQQCHYDHYQNQVCETVPVPQVNQAKETECQRCRKYTVPTPTTKWAIECNPVYDEKCKTSYPQHCKVEQRCHQLYQTVCGGGSDHGYGGQSCESVPREHCYPETKCHRTPMTRCQPVQKEKCVKVPREVIVQKEEKQCLPFEISQAELDAQANADPCLQQGFVDLGGKAIVGQAVGSGYDVPHGGGLHHGDIGHAHQPVNDGYGVGPPQHQQAVNGYQVDHASGHGHDHGHAQHAGSNIVPVDNLYTVDAYVPGGVVVNEALPSNQYYGGRIGERREVPSGAFSQNPAFNQQLLQQPRQQQQHLQQQHHHQQQPLQHQIHPNQVNVAVMHDPIFGLLQDGHIQFNSKRQLNPAIKSKNPFLRRPNPFLRKPKRTGAEKKRQRSLSGKSNRPTSNPIRFEETSSLSQLNTDIDTNVISDLVSPLNKKKATKNKLELAKGRFTSGSYEGWKPILYPVEGRRR